MVKGLKLPYFNTHLKVQLSKQCHIGEKIDKQINGTEQRGQKQTKKMQSIEPLKKQRPYNEAKMVFSANGA